MCFVVLAYPFHTLQNQLVRLLSEVIREARAGTWSVLNLWNDLHSIWLESLFFAPGAAFLAYLFAPQKAEQRLLALRQQQVASIRNASRRVERRMIGHQFVQVRGAGAPKTDDEDRGGYQRPAGEVHFLERPVLVEPECPP